MGQLIKSTSEINAMLSNNDGNADTNYRIVDGVIQIKDTSTGLYHTLWIDTGILKWAQTGEA